ncbi:UNVERIFIED_CONTAM: Trihelix transcription factor GT-2 [Sesamum radiatum]|uniref:Trihelix transcription factor GT-2 n=1 Tax=Sesamum radiatum TaxID=300843 RepID=A0AAW2M4M5_SESRA
MMLGVSGLMGSSGDGAAAGGAAAAEAHESGGASGGSSEVGGSSSIIPGSGVEESERSGGGGNRWPRQETLALLKIRSDMDVAFRDSNLKGPLWEEVSRKMAELGFQRSAKKCKEKFENVYKYHKRTKRWPIIKTRRQDLSIF